MENRRFFLICLLGVTLFFIYQAWQSDYASVPRPEPAAVQAIEEQGDVPATSSQTAAAHGDGARPASAAGSGREAMLNDSARIDVRTDRLHAQISLRGGDLRRVDFLGYAVHKDAPNTPVALVDDRAPHFFVIQSGLTGSEAPLASQYSDYRAAQTEYALADGQDQLAVVLETTGPGGVLVRKTYRFTRGSYEIGLEHELVNNGQSPLTTSPYVQLWRTEFSLGDEPRFSRTFTGLGVYEQKDGGDSYRFRKLQFDDLEDQPLQLRQTGGWLTMMQHYFLAAVIPDAKETHSLIAKPSKTRGYLGQYVGAAVTVAPGASQAFDTRLYVGPTLQDTLDRIAPGFELTVDYGILTPIAQPLFWVLEQFHKLTGNWGWSIVLLTLLVKGAMYKLSEAQYRSMAKMRKFGPRIKDIKERYGDDREKLHKAMMDLYKKEGFNPLGGCWPILIQFPVFISLYWVLLQSVELRQADFMLWINDLSSPDPYYVLPVLFGISMFVQQKLSGQTATMEPMQQRIMNAMPIGLTAFFAFFPAGLVLYWFVSNLIGLVQQWYIYRKLDHEGLSRR